MAKGRPKGYSPYIDITYEELGDWVGRKSLVKVSKAWLEEISNGGVPLPPLKENCIEDIPPPEPPKIKYNLIDLNEHE